MPNKILPETTKTQGGIVSFIATIKREVNLWKIISLVLFFAFLVLTVGRKMNSNLEPITTKDVAGLRKDVIAEIRIEGAIFSDAERDKMFSAIKKSDRIKGLLVVINSPGGTPNASEIIYNNLKYMGEKIPVVAFVEDMAASGGYMSAIGASKIIAMRTSVLGSIGIRGFAKFDLSGPMKKFDVGYEEYASSEYKTAGNMFSRTTKNQSDYFKETLMQGFEVFKEMVGTERKLNATELSRVANAKVFFGEKALELKLIDAIGTKDFALSLIEKSLNEKGIKNLDVLEINPEPKRVDSIFGKIMASLQFASSFIRERFEAGNVAKMEI